MSYSIRFPLGHQVGQHPAERGRSGEAGGLRRVRAAGQHALEAADDNWHALLDGPRSDPAGEIRLQGGHLVAGHHRHRAGRGCAAAFQHSPHAGSISELDSFQAIFMIPNREPPRLREPQKWSPEFNDFIARCLVKDPNERASGEELLEVRACVCGEA